MQQIVRATLKELYRCGNVTDFSDMLESKLTAPKEFDYPDIIDWEISGVEIPTHVLITVIFEKRS